MSCGGVSLFFFSVGNAAGAKECNALICPSGAEAPTDSPGTGDGGWGLLCHRFCRKMPLQKKAVKGLNTYMLKELYGIYVLKDLYGIYERYSLLSCFVFAEVRKKKKATRLQSVF